MPKRLPRTRTLKGDPPLAHYDSVKAIDPSFTVLLIHASLARSEDWENIFPRLATRYRTVAYDLRGHGKSGRASDYSLRAFGADAVRMLRGIVRDPAERAKAVVSVAEALADALVPVIAIVPSRLPGREGNREIFVHARRAAAPPDDFVLYDAARRAAE